MPSEENILEEIKKIVLSKADVDASRITLDADFREDLHISSIVIVSIVLAVENRYDIQISDDEIVDLATVGDAVRFIAARTD